MRSTGATDLAETAALLISSEDAFARRARQVRPYTSGSFAAGQFRGQRPGEFHKHPANPNSPLILG
jgi:hypothetical protein